MIKLQYKKPQKLTEFSLLILQKEKEEVEQDVVCGRRV